MDVFVQTQTERQENALLRAENDKLRAENARYKEALANVTCPSCGGPGTAVIGEMSFDEQHLSLENARLRDEIDRISSIAAKYVGKPTGNLHAGSNASSAAALYPPPSLSSHHLPGADMLALHHGAAAGIDKPLVIELAVAAMEELVRMAQLGEPLWVPAVVDGVATEVLNEEEYARSFPRGVGPKSPELRSEASRETVVVIMNHVSLVEMLMDTVTS
jgi:homeobox-leucine zipper protein